MNPASSRLPQVMAGALDTLPLTAAAMPFGIIFGALAVSTGFSDAFALTMSLLVFAGASQFIALSLLGAGALAPVILATVFLVNLRHLLYSATLMEHAGHLPHWARIPLAFWMTDETFAVVSSRRTRWPEAPGLFWYYLGSALLMYSGWQLFTWTGVTLGRQVPGLGDLGLDVAMVIAFSAIVASLLKGRSGWVCAITAMLAIPVTVHWPYQLGFLFSTLLAIGSGLLTARLFDKAATHA